MSNIINSIRTAFANWRTRRTTIQALSALNDHQLRDIGIHRSEIISVAAELTGQGTPTRVHTLRAATPAAQVEPLTREGAVETDWRQAA